MLRLRVPTEVIELRLDRVCDVFSNPADHIYVEQRCLRLDLLNVVRNDDTEASREIEFGVASRSTVASCFLVFVN
ncbi:hypothetical protein [Paraburkholderia sp. BR10937]|uniref:hypothetical protein n=1 Tax=Paraburkholderia sp. BR10937 TaxID=3236994 RepID=UPI0034D1CC45